MRTLKELHKVLNSIPDLNKILAGDDKVKLVEVRLQLGELFTSEERQLLCDDLRKGIDKVDNS
jgi:hypothetical protein